MTITSRLFSAAGKLAAVIVLLIGFLAGMTGVVYMSLSGSEVTVPDLVGKDFVESERELAALGLKIKRRAERPSTEKINTVLEQSPKAGETLKTGNMIFVVVSKAGAEGEAPVLPKKNTETDDTEKIEEMISEKPRKPRSNTNTTKKKADTTRDINANEPYANTNSNTNSNSADGAAKKGAAPANNNKNSSPGPAVKPQVAPTVQKPSAAKLPGAETRPRPSSRP